MPPLLSNNHGKTAAGGNGGNGSFAWSKNFITEQDWIGVFQVLNGSSWGFDAVRGLGTETPSSTVVLLPASNPSGPGDIEVTAEFEAPDTTLECGVMIRVIGFNSPNANYYWARLTGGEAHIARTLAGTTTSLESDTFAHSAQDVITVTVSIVGETIAATFENITDPNTVSLQTQDSNIEGGGLVGLRTGFTDSQIFWRTVSMRSL